MASFMVSRTSFGLFQSHPALCLCDCYADGRTKVPASSTRFLEKSRGLVVDHVTYDLEDSVTPSKKAEARVALRKFLEQPKPEGIREVGVRINSIDTGYALEDMTEVVRCSIPMHIGPRING